MTVRESTMTLSAALASFEARREEILGDRTLTQEGKARRLLALEASTLPVVERELVALWGAGEPDDDRFAVPADSTVWRELAAAEEAIRRARGQAAAFDHAQGAGLLPRLRSLLALYPTPADFEACYQGQMTPDERLAAQEYLAGLLVREQHSAQAWRDVLRAVNQDRERRVNPPAVERADAALVDLILAVEEAYQVSRRAANTFGRLSEVVTNALRGVKRDVRYIAPSAEDPEGGYSYSFEPVKFRWAIAGATW